MLAYRALTYNSFHTSDRWIDRDLDHLRTDPKPAVSKAPCSFLYSTDPTQENLSSIIQHDSTAPNRQPELLLAGHTDLESICAPEDLDHQAGIDGLVPGVISCQRRLLCEVSAPQLKDRPYQN